MILTDQMLQASRQYLRELNTTVKIIEEDENFNDDSFRKLELNALKSVAVDVQSDIDKYQELKSGEFEYPRSFSLSGLPDILIRARIAKGWTQLQLAERTNTEYKRLQLYEDGLYFGASVSKMLQIADILEIDTSKCYFPTTGESEEDVERVYLRQVEEPDWRKFPIKQAFDLGWIQKTNQVNEEELFKIWYTKAFNSHVSSSFHRRNVGNDQLDKKEAIMTWEARILHKAESEIVNNPISDFNYNERWVNELAGLTVNNDGPLRVADALREQGVLLIIEKHLPATCIDGATMLSHEGIPIIALTLRFDRLDYFWFTLFHELGHVFRHLFTEFNMNFFDHQSTPDNDTNGHPGQYSGNRFEVEANRFALDKLIEPDLWNTCLSRFAVTEQAVKADAKRIGVHESIIAGRIRNDMANYTILSDLVGEGQVRKLFASD